MRSHHHFDKTGVVKIFEDCETSKICAQVYRPGDLCISLSIGCGVTCTCRTSAPLAYQ